MSRPGRELTTELIDRMAYWRGIGYSIAAMCRQVGISTSTYYRWVREAEEHMRFMDGLRQLKELGFFDPENEAAILAACEANERARKEAAE